jgi:hypothetical protein
MKGYNYVWDKVRAAAGYTLQSGEQFAEAAPRPPAATVHEPTREPTHASALKRKRHRRHVRHVIVAAHAQPAVQFSARQRGGE